MAQTDESNRRRHRRSRLKPLLSLARPFLSLVTRQQLPTVVDLRSFLTPVEEQFTAGSCVGNALASVLDYFYYYTTGEVKRFSRLFIYYNARMMEDEFSRRSATEFDSGADIQFAIVSLITYGCCEEQFWPFYEHLINTPPTPDAYANGENYRLHEFSRLSNDIYQLRQCLAQGYPFVMAIRTFPSFDDDHRGYIPMPRSREKSAQFRHAVVCVGYSHPQRVFIIRNSHGAQWGDHGYGYLPYDYMADKVLTKDLWAIKSVHDTIPKPLQQQIILDGSVNLTKSRSQQNLTDDQINPNVWYESDEDEEEPEVFDRSRQPYRYHSQDRQREPSASSVPHNNHHPIQAPLISNFPPGYLSSPLVFAHPSPSIMGASYPLYPPRFNAPSFFHPF